MSLILSGSDGLSDVDGSAATPAIRGTDTNTGIFFPAADTIAFATSGTEDARFDSAGNFMVAQTSATGKLSVTGTGSSNTGILAINATDTANTFVWASQALNSGMTAGQNLVHFIGKAGSTRNAGYIGYKWSSDASTSNLLTFGHFGADNLMNLDGSGNLLVGTTSAPTSSIFGFSVSSGGRLASSNGNNNSNFDFYKNQDGVVQYFIRSGSVVGSISITSAATTYATASDYRLKNSIAPMTGALAKVALLKPCTYKWNVDGSDGQGFIAHELAEVVPQCVTGEKDAVDAEGKPQYQGIDTSFLVATLTAAIQEQQAIIESLKARLDAANL